MPPKKEPVHLEDDGTEEEDISSSSEEDILGSLLAPLPANAVVAQLLH